MEQESDRPNAMHLLGVLALREGRALEAADWIEKAIRDNPENPVFHNSMGLAYVALERRAEAIESFRQAVELAPRFAEAHNNLGSALKAEGQAEQAVACYQTALVERPDYAEACNNLGGTLTELGRAAEALPWLERAVTLRPEFADAQHNLARALGLLGQTPRAIAHYRQALESRPGDPDTLNDLGTALDAQGMLDEAADCYQQAINARADSVEPHVNLGNLLRAQGELARAIECFHRALVIQPDLAEAHNSLGNARKDQRRLADAAACYATALRFKPDHADAHFNLGNLLADAGRTAEARTHFERAIQLRPDKAAWRLRRDTLCPPLFASGSEIDDYRRGLSAALASFLSDAPEVTLSDLASSGCEPSFALNFHGLNNRLIKEQFASIFASASCRPDLQSGQAAVQSHQWPDCKSGLQEGSKLNGFNTGGTPVPRRPHIGFVVTRGHEGIFLRSMAGIINGLTPGRFRTTIFAPRSASEKFVQAIRHPDARFIGIHNHLRGAAHVIQAARCDLLYHWEIGTDGLNYALPFLRLAPVQCTSWGIQDTSGNALIDYYLSSTLTEPPGAGDHYTERLFLLRTLPSFQQRLSMPEQRKGRADFGLAGDDHIYLCAQNLLKFHPDFDPLLAGILRRDPQGRVVLTAGGDQAGLARRLDERFRAAMADVSDRISFLPRPSGADYLNLLLAADCLLDPLHFGGVNTTYDGFSLSLPIVTLPSEFHRGRYTLGCYRKMGLLEPGPCSLVASSPDEYVAIAVRLGSDSNYRAAIRADLSRLTPALFDDREAIIEHERFFVTACGG